METNQNVFTAEDGFNTIQSMIANARKQISDNGWDYLFWGTAAIACSLLNYYLLRIEYANPFISWLLMPALVPFSFLYHRFKKKVSVTSHFQHVYQNLWLGFGITLGVLLFVTISMGVSPYPALLALIGIATFTSGAIIRFAGLKWGAVVFWSSAISSAFVPVETQCLIYAGALVAGYIVPGIRLMQRTA